MIRDYIMHQEKEDKGLEQMDLLRRQPPLGGSSTCRFEWLTELKPPSFSGRYSYSIEVHYA